MTIPDTRSMLPSKACATLTAYLLERLQTSPLNDRGEPTYGYAEALGEMPLDIDGYAWMAMHACYEKALETFREQTRKVSK